VALADGYAVFMFLPKNAAYTGAMMMLLGCKDGFSALFKGMLVFLLDSHVLVLVSIFVCDRILSV
jgi:hypothetical protein